MQETVSREVFRKQYTTLHTPINTVVIIAISRVRSATRKRLLSLEK